MNNQHLKLVRDFIIAALLTFVLASVSHTQFVLIELADIGVEIDLAIRINASYQDLLGLLPAYAPVIAFGLLIGFSFVVWLKSLLKFHFNGLYPIAGGLSLLAIHALMQPILEITLIAGARSITGLIMQIVAGIIGGWVFYLLRKK